MALPVIVPSTAGVADAANKFVFQVDTSNSTTLGTGTWLTVFGCDSSVPVKTDNMVDITNFDTVGWSAFQPFLSGWTATLSLFRMRYPTAYDAGQEFLRAANEAKSQLHVRIFDRTGGSEAYEGFGYVQWENQSGGPNDPLKVNATFTGNGARTVISNPVATNSAPVVSSATPSGAAVGTLLRILGSFFTGATTVTIGGVSVVQKDIVSDNQIEILVPAGTAGSAPIIVTNTTGASNSLAYTRGA